ncbi:hypothetical protein [Streptomyces sp. NBC_01092]|uniref:hypothetical protein n=1 Tax=Streptomyces sp. NBC_01092 TaxID=2903748 RepID=UPI00386383A8|nr:hypothetical protein OG254_14325 [Streptomyces sp. NBC_01092]
MKLRTPPPERRPVTVARPDGSTFETTKTVEFAPVPVPPVDWDVISTRVAVGAVLTLTAVAVAWSTWSIGSLLHGGMGFLAALVFDLSWAVCLILEWKARFDPGKRAFPRSLGWVLLVVTMGAIFWHAWPDLGYAVIGALVSAVAKGLWLGIMKHIDRELSPVDRDDLADRLSKAYVRQAVASVDRQTLRVDAHTAAVRSSLEAARPTVLELSASTRDTDPAELARAGEQFAEEYRDGPAQDRSGDRDGPAQDRDSTGTTADRIRELISQGVTTAPEIGRALATEGVTAEPGYVRRVVRSVNGSGGGESK